MDFCNKVVLNWSRRRGLILEAEEPESLWGRIEPRTNDTSAKKITASSRDLFIGTSKVDALMHKKDSEFCSRIPE